MSKELVFEEDQYWNFECPECHSENIEQVREGDFDEEQAITYLQCQNCGLEFEIGYSFAFIQYYRDTEEQ